MASISEHFEGIAARVSPRVKPSDITPAKAHNIRHLLQEYGKSAKRKKAEFVYILGTGREYVKVGRSVEPERRRTDIQVGAAMPLVVAYSRLVTVAPVAEKIAHSILAPCRQSGEWFSVSVEEAIKAVNQACDIAEGKIPPPVVPWAIRAKPCARSAETQAKAVTKDARDVVVEFLRHLDELVGAGTFTFQTLRLSYEDLRTEAGWPPLSDKVFSLALQQCGCVVSTIDDRKRGRGRYRAYEFRGTP